MVTWIGPKAAIVFPGRVKLPGLDGSNLPTFCGQRHPSPQTGQLGLLSRGGLAISPLQLHFTHFALQPYFLHCELEPKSFRNKACNRYKDEPPSLRSLHFKSHHHNHSPSPTALPKTKLLMKHERIELPINVAWLSILLCLFHVYMWLKLTTSCTAM